MTKEYTCTKFYKKNKKSLTNTKIKYSNNFTKKKNK